MRSDGEREPDLGLQVHVPLHRHHHEQPDGRLCHPRGYQIRYIMNNQMDDFAIPGVFRYIMNTQMDDFAIPGGSSGTS